MSNAFYERLANTKESELRCIATYVAEQDCAGGGDPGYRDCDCVCCTAWRMQRQLWPADYPSVGSAVIQDLLKAMQGLPGYSHATVHVQFRDGRRARVNLDC